MLGRMVIDVGTHYGPWTEEDLTGILDNAQHYELLEGTLLVHPLAGGFHQVVRGRLTSILGAAEVPDLLVVPAIGVRLGDDTMLIPDILVATRDIALADESGILDSAAVALVVEIVSPKSRTTDRVTKPAVYARAGIASFWRVELEEGPAIFAYRLEQGRYVEVGVARPGERLVVHEPFPVSIDPADLQP